MFFLMFYHARRNRRRAISVRCAVSRLQAIIFSYANYSVTVLYYNNQKRF